MLSWIASALTCRQQTAIKTNNKTTTIGQLINTNEFAFCTYPMRLSKTQTHACLTRRRVLYAYFGPNIFDLYCRFTTYLTFIQWSFLVTSNPNEWHSIAKFWFFFISYRYTFRNNTSHNIATLHLIQIRQIIMIGSATTLSQWTNLQILQKPCKCLFQPC